MKLPLKLTTFGAALIVLTVGAAPLLSSAADHIDASAFGSLGSPGGAFNPLSVNGERDINDVYAFQGSNASRTVLVMTTNPAINAFGGKFGPNVRYILNVDRNGDAVQDLAYVVRFDNGAAGNQKYTVKRYTGANARSLTDGIVRGTGSTAGNGTREPRGQRQGLRRRSVRPVLLRPDRVRRDPVQHRHRRPRRQPDRHLHRLQHQRDRDRGP